MLTDGRTDGRTDDGRKVITIAHPEQSSGELKKKDTIWLSKSDVLCKVDTPVATGKSEKMYKLDNQTLEKVQKLYKGD